VRREVGDGLFDTAVALGLLLDPEEKTFLGGGFFDVNALDGEVQNWFAGKKEEEEKGDGHTRGARGQRGVLMDQIMPRIILESQSAKWLDFKKLVLTLASFSNIFIATVMLSAKEKKHNEKKLESSKQREERKGNANRVVEDASWGYGCTWWGKERCTKH
jgi:hypothetical protein